MAVACALHVAATMRNLAALVIVTACNSSTNPGAPVDAHPDSHAHADAREPADGPRTIDASIMIDAPFSSTEVGFAVVTMNDATDFNDLTINAAVGFGQEHENACQGTAINGCCVISTIGFAIVGASIGPIEIDDGAALATLQPLDSYPTYFSESGRRWTAGDSVAVWAPGGSLSAFSDTIPAPGPVTGLVPPIPVGNPTFDQSVAQNLTIRWTPDAYSADFTIQISSGGSNIVECHEPQAQGSVVVDHSLYSGAGLLAGRMASVTAINSTTHTLALSGSSSPVTISAQSQIGGNETINFVP